MVEPCSIGNNYISKQYEYITKDHIAMHKTASYFSSLVV